MTELTHSPPGMPHAQPYDGVFRGIVESVNDPEKRGRYRVRVRVAHEDTTPADHLPWAEICGYGGRGFGDVAHYEIGDRVWVQFEGGMTHLPVILGGWVSNRHGIHDLNPEQTLDYETDRRRWHRVDRASNLIEMSERGDELHIRLKSGNSQLVISQVDDSIRVDCAGSVRINAEQVNVTAKQAFTVAEDIVTTAHGTDAEGVADGQNNMYASDEARVVAGRRVDIGQYEDDTPGKTPHQSDEVVVQPRHAQVGVKETGNRKRTFTVNIEGHTKVDLTSNGDVHIGAPRTHIQGYEKLDLDGNWITVTAGKKLTLKAPEIVIEAARKLSMLAPYIRRVTDYLWHWTYFTRSYTHSGKGTRI